MKIVQEKKWLISYCVALFSLHMFSMVRMFIITTAAGKGEYVSNSVSIRTTKLRIKEPFPCWICMVTELT
jgi:hypothetical protein